MRDPELWGVLITLAFYATMLIGWVANIVKLWHIVSEPIGGLFVLRAIGIFVFPVGSVMGFI
jgi:hypothetical protein